MSRVVRLNLSETCIEYLRDTKERLNQGATPEQRVTVSELVEKTVMNHLLSTAEAIDEERTEEPA